MAQVSCLCALAMLSLGLGLASGGMDACYDPQGRAQRCMPTFENAAFGKEVWVTNTCGSPPEDYCLQMGARDTTKLCHRCDAGDPLLHHNATYLTDFHSQEDSTWWQSQSMAFGIQHPNSVNLTLHLGKSYEITYVRLKFHTSRPESFAIYKRSRADGPWIPYQYYSASCGKTYRKQERQYLRSGEDEQVAFCTEEFSDISPLSGGNVAFSTLEGRPSAYSFDKSPVLQEWVTATALLISLNRLNTFGDDIFKDPKVLQSYYYAISDFSVGGRCKCNGHASQCAPNEAGHLVCLCQHNTTGVDCEQCRAFYQDRPWARGTAESANECLPCNCSGRSVECFYDRELYRSTGHGGHCLNCQDNTAGPHCERCQQNYYRWDGQTACQPCNCNTAGSLQLQCDSSGACECKAGVTGWKCERCQAGFHSLSAGGCRPCACDPAGSVGTCDPSSGRCACKERVEGYLCDRCQPGSFNLQPHNPAGCSSCFCYGHSTVCRVATHYEVHHVRSDFSQGPDGWTAKAPSGKEVLLHWAQGEIYLEQDGEEPASFIAPEKFLQDQRLSYRQLLSLLFQAEGNGSGAAPFPVRLVLEGDGIVVSASYTPPVGSERQPHHGQHKVTFRLHEEAMRPLLSSFGFQRLLSNLTALKLQAGTSGTPCRVSLGEVQLSSARPGRSQPAPWVEECICPQGYTGQFCESCAPGFKRAVPLGGPFTSCIPCTCNQHGSCDPDTGHCQCLHHTEGPSCERCAVGFYGNPFRGHVDDCQPCPCPGRSPCTALPGSGEPVCTHCPGGQRGRRCELCDDGFFGDPLGERGPALPCSPCQCNGNVDPNAVGNCDPVSGQCLRCLYDTTGEHCERCREGFYGSALAPSPAEKCAPCKCDAAGSALGAEPCDPVTGQCTCLPHVTGRDCSHCQPGYYDLQPETGCKSCECHPVGSQASLCHPLTGQCPCQPGVAGRSCDRCQPGFFGFSVKGCRACNCSPLGAATPQCHENSTCLCRPGFVGYKCHQCQVNFFNAPPRAECQACPVCYSLVQEEADKLTAKLQELEVWLQRPDCSSPGTHYAVLGEEPHGDRLQPGYQLPDAKAVFLEQVAQLESSVSAAWGQLRNASGTGGCDQKTCLLLSEISARLQSAQQEIQGVAAMLATMVVPQDVSEPPASWSHQALEAQKLAASHRDTAAQVESVARRALLASNLSHALLQSILEDSASLGARNMLEDRYQAIQRVQQELAAGLLEGTAEAKRTFASIRRANAVMGKNLSRLSAVELDPLVVQTDVLTWELVQLEQGLEGKERLVVDKSGMLMAEPRRQLQRAELCQQLQKGAEAAQILAASSVSHGQAVVSKAKSLLSSVEAGERMFVHQKGQAAVRRKLAILRDRVLLDAQKKIRQAERMLGNSVSVSTAAKKTVREADGVARENAKRSQAVRREGKQQHKHAGELAQRVSLTLAEISRQEHVSEGLRAASQQATVGLSEAKESLQEAQRSLQVDIETLNNLLSSLDTMEQDTHAATVLSTSRLQLDRLWLRLARPGALERKLSHLQREAEQQRQKIRAFENDLQEIRADKQNLEEVLQSLPEGCSSWQ